MISLDRVLGNKTRRKLLGKSHVARTYSV